MLALRIDCTILGLNWGALNNEGSLDKPALNPLQGLYKI